MSALIAATTLADEIQYLSLDELDPSSHNPRKSQDADKVAELAASIAVHGILVPLLIREVPIEGEIVRYEIIAGSRRAAGASLAGLTHAPCIVRQMTDDEARELGLIDNRQREDMQPLEEARAFNEAMTLASLKMLSVQELAARLGKTPVYINRRLTLLDLVPAAQEALTNGAMEVGHALELARLTEDEQGRLLSWLGIVDIADDEDDDEYFENDESEDESPVAGIALTRVTTKSVVELRKFIRATTLHVLGAAPFDPNDADLVGEAGSCADCAKRSGASPLLFSDVSGEDICTDRVCFDGKVKAHVTQKLADAKAARSPLHRITTNYGSKEKDVHYQYGGLFKAGEKTCETTIDAIYIDGSEIGKVIPICIGGSCKIHGGRSSRSSSAPDPKAKEKRKQLLARVKVEKSYRLQLLKELLAKPIDALPTDAMVHALVSFAFTRIDNTKHEVLTQALGWAKDAFGWSGEKERQAKLVTLTQADAMRIARGE